VNAAAEGSEVEGGGKKNELTSRVSSMIRKRPFCFRTKEAPRWEEPPTLKESMPLKLSLAKMSG
jgi:hypothetical protein